MLDRLDRNNLSTAATDGDLQSAARSKLTASGDEGLVVELPPYGIAVLDPR